MRSSTIKPTQSFSLDPLFSPRFYHVEEMTEQTPSFPLPASPETLGAFLASESGTQYKQAVTQLVDTLDQWASKHDIRATAACANFKTAYLDYSGSDLEMNQFQFPLYTQGIIQLSRLVGLLDHAEIPSDYQVTVIRNLIEGLDVCAPGTFTNITDAYWQLVSRLSLGMEWMVARRKIAEQTALEALQTLTSTLKPSLIRSLRGMEIHYVNGALNQYADLLAFKPIEDDATLYCDPKLMTALSNAFQNNIPKRLTPDAVIQHIMFEQGIETLPQKLGSAIQAFQDSLARYGQDPLFVIHDLFDYDNIVPQLKWDHEYHLYLTFAHRLIQSNYFDDGPFFRQYSLADGVSTVHYLSKHGLKFAHVQQGQAQIPLISYCVSEFQKNRAITPDLLTFICSNEWEERDRFELVQGMLQWIRSRNGVMIEADTDPTSNQQCLNDWLDLIALLHPSNAQFDVILSGLAPIAKEVYLQKMGFTHLVALIQSGAQLVNVLKSLSKGQGQTVLTLLGHQRLFKLIQTGSQFADILAALPVEEWDLIFDQLAARPHSFLDSLSAAHLSFTLSSADSVNLLMVIFSNLPFDELHKYLSKLYPKGFQDAVVDLNDFCAIFNRLPNDKALCFLQSFSTKQLDTLSSFRHFLRKDYYWFPIRKLFKTASVDKIDLFLTHFCDTTFNHIVSNRHRVTTLAGIIPIEKMALFLKKITNIAEKISSATFLLMFSDVEKTAVFIQNLGADQLNLILKKDTVSIIFLAPKKIGQVIIDLLGWESILNLLRADTFFLLTALWKNPIMRCISPESPDDLMISSVLEHMGKDNLLQLTYRFFLPMVNLEHTKTYEDSLKYAQEWLAEIPEQFSTLFIELYLCDLDALGILFAKLTYLVHCLVNESTDHCAAFIDSLETGLFVNMVLAHPARLLAYIKNDKCTLIANKLGEKNHLPFLHALKQDIDEKPSLMSSLQKLPRKMRQLLLKQWPVATTATLIQDRDTLFAALVCQSQEDGLNLVNAFTIERLHELLLKEHSLTATLSFIKRIVSLPDDAHQLLLLATLRAQQHSKQQKSMMSIFWTKLNQSNAGNETQAYTFLETALLKNLEHKGTGTSFLHSLDQQKDMQNVTSFFRQGELGQLVEALLGAEHALDSDHTKESSVSMLL